MIAKSKVASPVTFDGALPAGPDRKTALEQRKRALEKELKQVEAAIGQS
jgi:hypothetical protein